MRKPKALRGLPRRGARILPQPSVCANPARLWISEGGNLPVGTHWRRGRDDSRYALTPSGPPFGRSSPPLRGGSSNPLVDIEGSNPRFVLHRAMYDYSSLVLRNWRRGRGCSTLRVSSLARARDHRRFAPVSFAAASRRLAEPPCRYLGFESLPHHRRMTRRCKEPSINYVKLAEREG
jgi:hypothetical protein